MKKIIISLSIMISVLTYTYANNQTLELIELSNWKFSIGDNLGWASPEYNDSAWKPIKVGSTWQQQGYESADGYAWYRIKFSLPSSLKNSAFIKDVLLFALGNIEERDQTFLNGKFLGQNANSFAVNVEPLHDLSKLEIPYNATRNYTIQVNDPRLIWDKENVLAIRVYTSRLAGGLSSSPINVRMKDLKDYLVFDLDSRGLHSKPGGMLTKTVILKNLSPLLEIKGKLTIELTNAENKKVIAVQTCNIDLKGEDLPVTFNVKGDILVPMDIKYTFIESKSNYKVEYTREPDGAGGWVKYENNPILGGHLGTIFDVQVQKKDEGGFQMNCSWRTERSIAVSQSEDGLKWSKPEIILTYDQNSNWEQDISRPFIIKKDGIYHMWYTGQVWRGWDKGNSYIGYASSKDGKKWTRYSGNPIIKPEFPWEDDGVILPQVIWDEQDKLFKMWYSAGDQFEPDAVGYATSKDGLHWDKYKGNPIFKGDPHTQWEQAKVALAQVIKRENDYLMFYIGYLDPHYAQIGMARSKDGITNWVRYKGNPIIRHGKGWDSEATYKASVVPDSANNRWLLYYNGRQGDHEQMGMAIHKGMDLGF